jgi:RNA polymerase sigma-70 factor (ECF subfamily)
MGGLRTDSLPLVAGSQHDSSVTSCTLGGLSDEDLIAHLQAGNHEAMNTLFRRYYRTVLSIALRIVRDAGEAEDVMQEVFLEVFRKCHLFDAGKGSAKGRILQYAYSRSINRRQHLTLRKFYDLQAFPSESLYGWEPCCAPVDGQDLTLSNRMICIQDGLASLSDKQRKIIELAYFEGLELNEIAQKTRESVVNVRNSYYRGVRKLRDSIKRKAEATA